MKHTIWIIALLLIMNTSALAQEETSLCNAAYVTEADVANLVMSVNDAQFTDEIFVNRIRFEHAYNAIKFEIRVAQINQQATAFNLDSAQIMSLDEQIRQINIENDTPTQLANRVLGELANDAIIWQYAEANNLSVSSEAFATTITEFFNIEEESPEELDAILNNFTQRSLTAGTVPSEIMTFFCRQALYDVVQEAVIGDVQTTLYVNADHILVSSQEVAFDIVTLLENGEDFATLAQQLSFDTGSAQRDGALGWQATIFFVPSFGDAVTTGEVATILAPVETQFGWHVIRINGREERPIEEDMREAVIARLFSLWREDQLDNTTTTINPDWQSFIPQL